MVALLIVHSVCYMRTAEKCVVWCSKRAVDELLSGVRDFAQICGRWPAVCVPPSPALPHSDATDR